MRAHFSLLIANWQRYALTPLLIVIFSLFAFFGFVRGSLLFLHSLSPIGGNLFDAVK
jgi:hypothetical protein